MNVITTMTRDEPACTACDEPQGTNARNGCPACVRWWKRVMVPTLTKKEPRIPTRPGG